MTALRMILGLVPRGIFSQTLCWFKVRCDAPSTDSATSLRRHPTWDNLNSGKFPSSAGRSTAENSSVDSGRTGGRERWPEVGHPTGHRRRVPVLGKQHCLRGFSTEERHIARSVKFFSLNKTKCYALTCFCLWQNCIIIRDHSLLWSSGITGVRIQEYHSTGSARNGDHHHNHYHHHHQQQQQQQ
jgi:hypothetical protein